jgi:hypothetical protein
MSDEVKYADLTSTAAKVEYIRQHGEDAYSKLVENHSQVAAAQRVQANKDAQQTLFQKIQGGK